MPAFACLATSPYSLGSRKPRVPITAMTIKKTHMRTAQRFCLNEIII